MKKWNFQNFCENFEPKMDFLMILIVFDIKLNFLRKNSVLELKIEKNNEKK